MFIYKTTNLVNGKIYIGQHCGSNPNYIGSGKLLIAAIKKYGRENFKREILEYCDNVDHMNEREIIWIARYDSTNQKIGYNLERGGFGVTEKARKKMSESKKGKELSEEHKKKISEANKRRKHSKETRRKMSKSMKGKKRSEAARKKMRGRKLSEETRRKLSEAHKGKKISEEHKKKLSEGWKNISEESKKRMFESNKGRKFSEETRKKMSKSMRGRKLSEEHRRKLSKAAKNISEETRKKMSEAARKIKVIQLTLDGLKVKIWDSTRDADKFGFYHSNISNCCKGKAKTHKGFKWMYLHEYEKGLNND